MTYRSSYEIIAEMLQTAKNGAKKTRLTNSCNLTYGSTKEFVSRLLEAGLLRKGDSFYTTYKGILFLQAFQHLNLLLDTRV